MGEVWGEIEKYPVFVNDDLVVNNKKWVIYIPPPST